ncbi:MAG TPA: thiol reductant ABC exporter subunit CydD [Solirubrobacteraceae bacterium]|jgi:ATP-binding cassette subfamily C protein CydD|nr:thiol reductant ABC exporter subunit CydD [Solirubrobacteraceae bacterium]
MSADSLFSPALVSAPAADTRRRLTEALGPGRRPLAAAGALTAAATGATATGFFAVAAVAQDVLVRHTSWAHDSRWLLVLAGAAAVRAGSAYLAARLAVDGALAVEKRLRARLLDRLIGGAGASLGSAAQATAVMDEVERVGSYAERYQPARVAAALVPLVLLAAVFPLNWLVGVVLVLCAPLPPVNLSIIGMGTAAVARRHAAELRHLSGYFLDRLRGLATLRALGAERAELERVSEASQRLAQSSMAVLRVAFVSAAALEAIVTVAVAVVAIYIGLTLLGYVQVPGIPGHMSLRTGLFLLMVTPLYFQPVRALAAAYHERADALAAIEALQPLLQAGPGDGQRGPARPLTAPPAIEISGLTVAFPGRELPALDDVSLAIRPGEVIGITGASGAGKSTLLRTLAGELEPASGVVRLDGVAPYGVVRTSIAWLGQRPYLFSGTLADNIALGWAGIESHDLHLRRAALEAGLGGVLARLPDGLHTPVGEGGWGLSGGEAHRVALARTFLARAPLVLLDEPTAHLDAASESLITEIIATLARSATTVLASHSPALLAICDRVITLDRGQLIGAASQAAVGAAA